MKICFFVLAVMAASSCSANNYHRGSGQFRGGGYPGAGPVRTVRVVLPNGVGPGGFEGPGRFHGPDQLGGGGYSGAGPVRTVRVVLPNGVVPGGFEGPGRFHGPDNAGDVRTIKVVLHPGSFGGTGGYDGLRGPIGGGVGGGVKIIKVIRQQSGGSFGHEGINGANGHVRTIRLIRQQAGGFGGNVGNGGPGGEVRTIKLIRQQAGGARIGGHGGAGGKVNLIRVIQPEHGDAGGTGAGDIETIRLIQQEAEGNSGSANLGDSIGAGGAVRTIVLRQEADRNIDARGGHGDDNNGSGDDVRTIRIINQEDASSNGGYSGDDAGSYGAHDEEDPFDTLKSLQVIGVLRKK